MSEKTYAEASSPFFEMGYHATGAVLLAPIEKKRGLPGVMNVMADPRRLLTAYNDCDSGSTLPFSFDPASGRAGGSSRGVQVEVGPVPATPA
jgi:hypothetical protein